MLTRRSFLENSLKMSAGAALSSTMAHAAAVDSHPLRLRMSSAPPISLPANFTGLGYEMSSVATPGLLSAKNDRYVQLVRGLGSPGVLRVGGIVANYTRYDPQGVAKAEKQDTVVTRSSMQEFRAFLDAVGWTAIWSINFAQGTIDDAIKEAGAVQEVLGPKLLAIELGNEVDAYNRSQPFRSSSYDYDAYLKEYRQWHAAITKALPKIPFAAPDTARSYDWVERMAADAHGDVQLLTTHYYRNGQRNGSAEQLLQPDPRLLDALVRLRTASHASGIPWRMCETNSFSGGGLPGVSNTFIGALWTLDFMLLLAAYGCSGVNIETGVNQLGFVSSYSPIQDDGKGNNTAGVPYYGMLAFASAVAGCDTLLPSQIDNSEADVTMYVLGRGARARCAVVVNKDRSQDVNVSINDLKMGDPMMLRLISPAAESVSGITFGGSSVTDGGEWRATKSERVHGATVSVPHMSAVVIRSDLRHL